MELEGVYLESLSWYGCYKPIQNAEREKESP